MRATTVGRGSRWRQAGCKINSIQGTQFYSRAAPQDGPVTVDTNAQLLAVGQRGAGSQLVARAGRAGRHSSVVVIAAVERGAPALIARPKQTARAGKQRCQQAAGGQEGRRVTKQHRSWDWRCSHPTGGTPHSAGLPRLASISSRLPSLWPAAAHRPGDCRARLWRRPPPTAPGGTRAPGRGRGS